MVGWELMGSERAELVKVILSVTHFCVDGPIGIVYI